MKSLLKVAVAGMLCAMVFAPEVWAQAARPVPHQLNVQGVLRNIVGEPVTGNYAVRFTIYAEEFSPEAEPVFRVTRTLSVTGGIFSTYLENVPTAVFVGRSQLWLGLQVGSDPELPRTPLTSVGFAYQAEHAEEASKLLGPADDLDCTSCVSSEEVSFPWAMGVSAGGAAVNVQCIGCISGGAGGKIGEATITSYNMAENSVVTAAIVNGAVTNAKLGADSVTSAKIMDGQVMTPDLADGSVTAEKLAPGAVGNAQVSFNYARSDSQGGPALDVVCEDPNGCIGPNEVTFTFAHSATKGGDASGLDCSANPCVDQDEVTFFYALSTTQGGPAVDLACDPSINGGQCVSSGEVAFNYAGSTSKGGPAIDVVCSDPNGCIASNEVTFNYAGSLTKGGAATNVECVGCITTTKTSFPWAAGTVATGGGAATGLSCNLATGDCVNNTDIHDGAINDRTVAATAAIAGTKIQSATGTTVGVMRPGAGLQVNAGVLTPVFGTTVGTVAEGNHFHSGYYSNGIDDLTIGAGKKIDFLGTGYPNQYSYFTRPTGTTAIRLTFGYTGGSSEYFEILSQSPANALGEQTHRFEAGGNAYHKGNLTLGGLLLCSAPGGCVNSASIVDGSLTSADIATGTIQGGNLASNITINTTGNITANNMYAKAFIDSDNTAYMADPAGTSRFNWINWDSWVYRTGTTSGLRTSTIPGSTLAEARLDHIAHPSAGAVLHMQYGGSGNIEAFTGGIGTMTVSGTVTADIFRDRNNTAYYVDPASASYVNQFRAGNSYINWDTDGRNYLRNNTYVGGVIYDEANTGYYLKPSATSRMDTIGANRVYLYSTATNPVPSASYGVMATYANHLYMAPTTGSDYVIMRYSTDNRIYFRLNGNADTSRPSFRTNGGYMVINAAAGNPLYLNLDVGGSVFFNERLVDSNATTCQLDPSDATPAGGTRVQAFNADRVAARQLLVHEGLRINGSGLFVVGNAYQDTGIRMYHWTTIAPVTNNTSSVGMASRTFRAMHSYLYYGASHRHLKRDIRYFEQQDFSKLSEMLHSLKPTTFYYNGEVSAEEDAEDPSLVQTVPHVGLMIDEMPDVLTNGGTNWSLTDSIGFLLASAKYFEDRVRQQDQELRDLEDRIALLEQVVVDAGLIK